uniref:Fanconi anemia group I protein n=1 Tax=Aegilops tauschii subsp. strangulata TaxID=200361 RepID=A0A453I489_AEGTS
MSADAVDGPPSSQQPPRPTVESVLQLASRDPSAAVPLLPALPPDALADLLCSLSAASPPNHLSLLPALLSLSPNPSAASAAFSSLLNAPSWPSPTLLAVASLLRDLPVSFRSRVPDCLSKVLSLLPGADVQDLPALAYQLLLLASKPLHPRLVLSGLLRFFGGRHGARVRAPPSIARQVAGTVLMHVAFAVKQDPALAREVVAAVKANAAGVLNGFAVAVLLSVARVRRFNDSAVGVLRDAATTSRRDYRMSRRCKWLPDPLKEESVEAAHCVEKALLKAVAESIGGREHVVPSIVQVGFLLLEASNGDPGDEDGPDEGVMSTEEIGVNMLKSLFETHEMARTEIIEQCKFRILSAKPQQSAPVLRLLGCLVRSHPFPMLEYVAHLKELLDYLPFMNDKISTGLINCILPLTKFSRDLKDYIILVVRKAMFKRADAVRIAATNAIVELIVTESEYRKNEANPFQDSSSQPSSSQQPEIHREVGVELFQELSGLLRRCLSQQARVKTVLYEGLIRIVTSDPDVADNVLDFLWPHFLNYYIENAECPLKMDSCFKVENAKLNKIVNVTDHVMHIGSVSVLLLPRIMSYCQVGRSSSRDLFMKGLSNIQKYLRKCLTEDQRGQTQEAGSASSSLEIVQCHNVFMPGIVEVFVDFAASKLAEAADEPKEKLEKEILELVDAHSGFERKTSKSREKVARRRGDSRGATDRQTNEPKENSNASLLKLHEKRGEFMNSSLYELVVMCARQCHADKYDKGSQRPSQSKLNQSSSLLSFVLKACLEMFRSLTAKSSGLAIGNLRRTLYEDVKNLAQPIVKLIWWLTLDSEQKNGGFKKNTTQGKRTVENKKDQLYLALTCFKELFKLSVSEDRSSDIIDLLISSAPSNIEDMMEADQLHDNDTTVTENPEKRGAHVFLNILKMLYARALSQSLSRESEAVSELIFGISRKLHPDQRHLVGHWAAGLCRKNTVQSPTTAQEMVKLAVHLMTTPDDMILVHEMTTELKKLIASGDEESVDSSEAFLIVNCKTKNSLVAVFLHMVDSSLIELEWGLGKLKAMLTLGYGSSNVDEDQPADERTQRMFLEEALYSRSTSVVHVLSSFTHMSLKDSQAEQFLKLTAKFYKLLARISKSQIAPKGYKQFIPGLKFQKMAEVTCRMLTAPLYNFVFTLQESEQPHKKGILAKIKRESKCIPDLIFQVEDYEKYLIQLSKLTKVNLLRHAKRSVARDFRIQPKEKAAEEEREGDSPPATAASPESDPEEDVEEGPDVPADENLQASAQHDDAVQDSESDGEEEEVLVHRKRANANQVVQDSESDGEEE